MKELTKITEPSQAIALYEITPEKIALQLKEYDHLKVKSGDTKSYKAVRAAHTALVTTRTTGDKRRKKLGEDARKQVSYINKAWAMLLGPMTPYEERFKAELKAEDDRKQAIKDKKARIEQERIDAIKTKIEFLHSPENLYMLTAEQINQRIDAVEDIEIDDTYMEFQEEAKVLVTATLNALYDAFEDRQNYEKKEVERKAEIEKLNRIKEENEAAQAKIDAEKAQIAEGKRLEAEAKDRAEFERIAKEAATAKAEKEAKDKIEREKQEKVDAENEAKRVEALRPDKEKLIAFAQELRDIQPPVVMDEKAQRITFAVIRDLDARAGEIQEAAEAL